MDWETVKKEYRVKSTEKLFGIEEPPDYQCPAIDKICNTISNISSSAEGNYLGYGNEDEGERLSDIKHEVRGLEDELEDVRAAVEYIRNWGQDWKDLAKQIIEKYEIDIEELT